MKTASYLEIGPTPLSVRFCDLKKPPLMRGLPSRVSPNANTVRSAETRQKIGQNQPIEWISVTEMTTRVEFWLTEN